MIDFREFAERAAAAHREMHTDMVTQEIGYPVQWDTNALYSASRALVLAAIPVAWPHLSGLEVDQIYGRYLRSGAGTLVAVAREVAPSVVSAP